MELFDIEIHALRALTKCLLAVGDEHAVNIRPGTGLIVKSVDCAHAMMVYAEVKCRVLCTDEVKIGVNFRTLDKVIEEGKGWHWGNYVMFSKDKDGHVIITAGDLRYVPPTVDPDGFSDTKIPNLNFVCSIPLGSIYLKGILSRAGMVSDFLWIEKLEKGVIISTAEDGAYFGVTIDSASGSGPTGTRSAYSHDYLSNVMDHLVEAEKHVHLNPVKISWSKDYPCELRCSVQDFDIKYFLSPRLRDEV